MSGNAGNAITGDLHTPFQTTLIDQGFQFIDVLLLRGAENGIANGMFSPAPLSFAPNMMAVAPSRRALPRPGACASPTTPKSAAGT